MVGHVLHGLDSQLYFRALDHEWVRGRGVVKFEKLKEDHLHLGRYLHHILTASVPIVLHLRPPCEGMIHLKGILQNAALQQSLCIYIYLHMHVYIILCILSI